MPDSPAGLFAVKRVVGPIEIYENLAPKGDAGELPAPRLIDLRGIVQRMIASHDGRWVYFLDRQNRKLGRIDTTTGTVDKTIDGLTPTARAFCVTPDGNTIYSCAEAGRIDIIDAAAFKLDKTVKVATGAPLDIAATDRGLVYLLVPGASPDPLDRGNCVVVDLSRPADKPAVTRIRTNHHSEF